MQWKCLIKIQHNRGEMATIYQFTKKKKICSYCFCLGQFGFYLIKPCFIFVLGYLVFLHSIYYACTSVQHRLLVKWEWKKIIHIFKWRTKTLTSVLRATVWDFLPRSWLWAKQFLYVGVENVHSQPKGKYLLLLLCNFITHRNFILITHF